MKASDHKCHSREREGGRKTTFWYNIVPKFRQMKETVSQNVDFGVNREAYVISTDIPDPLSPPIPIVHCFQQVFKGYIPYLHRAAVCRFELVVLSLLGHVKESTEIHHL